MEERSDTDSNPTRLTGSDFNTGEFTDDVKTEVTIDFQRFFVKVRNQHVSWNPGALTQDRLPARNTM